MEGNNNHEETNKWSQIDLTLIQATLVLTGDQKIDSENINALLLENVEEQKRNNEMPKGTRLGKTG